jgi:hypothetical protein
VFTLRHHIWNNHKKFTCIRLLYFTFCSNYMILLKVSVHISPFQTQNINYIFVSDHMSAYHTHIVWRTPIIRVLKKLIVTQLANSQLFMEPECWSHLPLITSTVTSLLKPEKSVRPINCYTGHLFVHDLVRKVLTSGSLVYTMMLFNSSIELLHAKESVVT